MKVIDSFHPGLPDLTNTGTSLLAVLVEDERGGLAVYEALIKLPPPSNRQAYIAERASKAQAVMHLGLKCNLSKAKAYFGAVTDKNYRP